MILVRGRDDADTRALVEIFDGIEGMAALPALPEDSHAALLVARSAASGNFIQNLPVDISVAVLVIADTPSEAMEAVLSGASDAVLGTSGREEMRLRAQLLLRPSCGRACTSSVFSRILRTELGRSGREGYELSLVSASVGSADNPWSLSEGLSSAIRSTDTPGVTADGRVVLLLPCTPPGKAVVVVKRLRTVLQGQGLGCSFKLAGGHIGHMSPAEALRLLAEAPDLP
jgi:hypothetical protein